jgi:hypothetical protein
VRKRLRGAAAAALGVLAACATEGPGPDPLPSGPPREPFFGQLAKLTAPLGETLAYYGYSVSVSGDTAIVGAVHDDTTGGMDAGAAYVFVRSGPAWVLQQRLVASDGAANDLFGRNVAVLGDTAVVGAYTDDTEGGLDAGSAYVFVRSGTAWTQQQKLTASDGADADAFGIWVALAGDTLVVGALGDDTPAGVNAGSAYVFVRTGAAWTEQQKLTASDAAPDDYFGDSVSMTADTLVIGARGDDRARDRDAGSAYVFVRSGTSWVQQQRLTGTATTGDEWFGYSVSVSGDTILVGARQESAAYVFVRSGTGWALQQRLAPPDGGGDDIFGHCVSLSGDTAVVGAAMNDHSAGADGGATYVFVRSGGAWAQKQKLLSADAAAGDRFGIAVAVAGNTLVIGADFDDSPSVADAGAAYVFRTE